MSRFEFLVQSDSEDNTGGGDSFPSRLKEHKQWLVTHDKPWEDDWHKRPKHPTSWNDDGTTFLWFEAAHDRCKSTDNTGIVLPFTDGVPFIDFDKVTDRKNEGLLSDCVELEVDYTDEHFVLTGAVYDGSTSVDNRSTVVREVDLPERQKLSFTSQQKPVSELNFNRGEADTTPEQVRQTIQAYVKTDSKG